MTTEGPDGRDRDFRSKRFGDTAEIVINLAEDLSELLAPIDEAEGLNVQDLKHVLGCLGDIFDSKAALDSLVLAPVDAKPWVNMPFLQDVTTHLSLIRKYLEDLTNVGYASIPIAELRKQIKGALRRAKLQDSDYLPERSRQNLESLIERISDNVDLFERSEKLRELEGRTEAAVTRTEAAAEVATKAAGKTGDDAMSSFYATLAKNEGKKADNFRWLTVFLALIGAGVALAFVLGHGSSVPWLEIPSDDYVHLAQRAILVAGAFGLAGYFARQAHQHRSMANWAGSLAVQLQTFDAYLAAIDSTEVKDELRKSFAARAFGDHPAMKGEPTVTPSAAAMDTAVGWAAKLTADK